MNYHYEETIKKYGIPHGRIFYWDAEQGAGKTSGITAWIRMDYKFHGEERRREAIEHYKAIGLNLSELPNVDALKTHLYYSNADIALKGSLKTAGEEYKTHNITADDICLPDGIHPAVYFPWGSVIFLQEASDKWHAYDWQKLAKNIRPWLKYLRHANLTLIIDTHSDSDIAKPLRDLATDELFVESRFYKPPRFFGLIKARTTWYFKWSLPQSIRAAERWGKDIQKYTQDVSFRIKGSVQDAYDGYSGEAHFLRGVYKYGFAVKKHINLDYTTAEGIENYCKHNSIITDVETETDKKQPAQDEKAEK